MVNILVSQKWLHRDQPGEGLSHINSLSAPVRSLRECPVADDRLRRPIPVARGRPIEFSSICRPACTSSSLLDRRFAQAERLLESRLPEQLGKADR